MAISLASLNRLDTPKPPRIIIYGGHGVGKNTFAASAPKPVLINIEDGHPTGMPVESFPVAKTFNEVIEAMTALYSEDHDFETVIIDSLDWLEPLVWAETIARNNRDNPDKTWASIEDAGYGKGYIAMLEVWRDYIEAIDALRNDKGMVIIQTAHSQVKLYKNPEGEPYDRIGIKLHERASSLLQEHADIVGHAAFKVSVTKAEVGMKKIARGVGGGNRVLYTQERPAFLAKNRHNLPPELPLDWNALTGAMASASTVALKEAA